MAAPVDRLDYLLVRTGAAGSLNQARKLIRQGRVRICTVSKKTRGARCAWVKKPKSKVATRAFVLADVGWTEWRLIHNAQGWRRQSTRS